MLYKHISVEFQDIFTTPKENALPKSMLTPHSPPICSLSLFTRSAYFVYMPSCSFPTIWCSRSLPLPLNIFFMRLLGSPCFLVFLTLISEHWRSRARYLSLSLSLLSPWLTHHGFVPSMSLQPGLSVELQTHTSYCLLDTSPLGLSHLSGSRLSPWPSPPSLLFRFMSSPSSKSSSRKPYSLHPWHFSFFP